ncbi:MAG TPA: glycosyltransferase family 39 protein, partial [Pirellulales bacterium]|nr:glycosyltransferase family 39 protein [Pirellulales bacterium]
MKPLSPGSSGWKTGLISAALLLATGFVLIRVCLAGFSNFDDPYYVTDNMHVRQGLSPQAIWWAFTSTDVANWHPLTWLSLELDYELFGLSPAGYHLTNLVLHLANTWLLFWTLRVYTGSLGTSAWVAALFGMHPLHVESVAWVTERKDVLSTLFWLLTMLAYHRYARRRSLSRYLIVALLLALGLMAKQMLVTLPCVLLLLDYWPLCRLRLGSASLPPSCQAETSATPIESSSWQMLVLEKLPLLVLCLACSVLTLIAQSRGGAVSSSAVAPLAYRLMNVTDAYVAYLAKTIWPLNLAVFYPHTLHRQSVLVAVGNFLVLLAITVWVFRSRRREPYLLVGWCWFLGTLVPVIGLVQVGAQALADRYTYVPLIGIFWMVVWGTDRLVTKRVLSAKLAMALGLTALVSFGACTWVQTGYWMDDVILWQHALAVSGPSNQVYDNLSGALLREGRYDDAL